MNPQAQKPSQPGDHKSIDGVEVISKLRNELIVYRTDIAERNTYIDVRDRYLYGEGLFEGLYIPDGFDSTMYNFLRRVVDIHTAQLMGEKFQINSYYEKEDLSQLEEAAQDGTDPKAEGELKQAEIENKMRETRAEARKDAIAAIIRDNGGFRQFKDGARVGSAYGTTLYQMWWDTDEKKIRIQLLESVQNWFPIWADNNFRERDGDAYVWQISLESANRKFGKYLEDGQTFPVSYAGDPLINIQGSSSTLTNQQGVTVSSATTRRPMVTVINYTGYLPNVAYDKQGNFVQVESGQETKLSFKAVGNTVVEKITKESNMPRIYHIPNVTVPRRPYGESDLPESALQINQTFIEQMSNELTLSNKTLFPIIQAKGFEIGSIPPRKQREVTIVPMMPEQGLEVVPMPTAAEATFERISNELKDAFLKVTAIPPVLFENPQSPNNSNAALLTTMRPIIDVVEDKQSRWEPVIREMFTDALTLAAEHDNNIAALVTKEDGDWWLYVGWPSVIRRDDPQHQAMLLNDFQHGLMSVDSYLEARGVQDVGQEIARISSALKDKIRAAIQGNRLGELAQFSIYEKLGVPLWGFNQPHITLKGDLTPQQEGNMADMYGWNKGPFGASIGPQGIEGEHANENVINQGFTTANPFDKYGFPTGTPINQPINPANPNGAESIAGNQTQPAPPMPGPTQGQPFPPVVAPGINPGAGVPSAPGVATPTSTSAQGKVKQRNHNKGKS